MTIDISLVIWTIICFVVFYFLLRTFLFKPIIKFMDERRARIEAGLNAREQAQHALEEKEKELNHELLTAMSAAQGKISAEAAVEEEARERALAAAREEAARLLKQAGSGISAEEAELNRALEALLPELVKTLSAKIVGEAVQPSEAELNEAVSRSAKCTTV